jgi:hypothetical protein
MGFGVLTAVRDLVFVLAAPVVHAVAGRVFRSALGRSARPPHGPLAVLHTVIRQDSRNAVYCASSLPDHFLLVQAEIRLVADQTDNATPVTIKADEQSVIDAEEIAKADSQIDIVA